MTEKPTTTTEQVSAFCAKVAIVFLAALAIWGASHRFGLALDYWGVWLGCFALWSLRALLAGNTRKRSDPDHR